MGRRLRRIGEEVLVAKETQPAKNILGFVVEDSGAKRDGEREIVEVEDQRRFARRVKEPVLVGANGLLRLFADQRADGLDVGGLEATDDRIVERKAERRE